MTIISQIAILFFVSFLSQIISIFLPFKFPTSIISMIVLFILLTSKFLNVKKIETVGNFLQKNIAIFFIPASVSIIDNFVYFKGKIFQIIFISFISFIISFLFTAHTVQLVIKIQNKRKGNKNNERNIR